MYKQGAEDNCNIISKWIELILRFISVLLSNIYVSCCVVDGLHNFFKLKHWVDELKNRSLANLECPEAIAKETTMS